MEDGSSASQPASPGQSLELLRDLEIECFSASKNIDVDACTNIYTEIENALSSTKALENKESNRLELLRRKILDQDAAFQEIQLKGHANERLFLDLVSERDSSKERLEKVKKAETVIKYEYQRIKSANDDVKKQADSVRLLNEDIVRPILEKKEFELRIASEESSSSLKELGKTKALYDEVSKQYSALYSNYDGALKIVEERKGYENQIKNRPHELQKEIELMNKRVANVEEELRRTRDQVAENQGKLLDGSSSKRSIESINRETMKKLEEQTKRCNRSKDEYASISKALALDQTKYHSLTTARVGIEIKLREAIEHLRHKRTAAQMQRKQLERMMRLYLKKKLITERSCEIVEYLNLKLIEDTDLIKEKQTLCADQFKAIENMKNEISVKVTRLLEQRNIEGDTKNELESLISNVEEKEIEVDRWRTEVKKLSKIISVLSSQKDIQAKKTKSIISDEKNTREMTKLKTFVMMDMNKVLYETNKRAREFGALYETLKRENNEIMASSSASSIALSEIRERIESDTNHMQCLRKSQEEKKNVLFKEKDSHESSKSSRSMLRVEKTNAYTAYREQKEEAERQKSKIDNLRSIMGSLQRDIVQLKARNGFLENRSRLMSDQMSHKKIELHSLLQRENVLEETLKRGELAIEQKKEDIRALQIQVSHVWCPCTLYNVCTQTLISSPSNQ
jgi:chromosome segregation ATPase